MGSQRLDPNGGRAPTGRSGGACSPHGPGELSPGTADTQPGATPADSITRQPVNMAQVLSS